MLKPDDDYTTRLRLELALEASGLVDWDFDYVLNTAHRSLRHDQLYGYSEMLPTWNFDNFFQHVLPEFHETVKKEFEDILPVLGRINFEFKIRRVDGEIRWLQLTGKSQKDKAGKIIRVAGILKDITDEKLASERLSLQTQNLTSLFEKSPEFFCLISARDFTYEFVNPAHVALFNGVNMTGHSLIEDQKEIDVEYIKVLKQVIRTGESVVYKDSPAQIGTRLRYIDMIFAPRRNTRGEVDGVYALGSDVTDKIMALKKAQTSAEQMRLITDKLPAFISYTDKDGRYQFMNAMYEKWFNKPVSEMLGKTRKEITPAEYAIQSKSFQDSAMDGKSSHHEGIIRKASGEALDLDIHFVPDVDPETKDVRGMIAVGVDVTQQVHSLKEAEIARRELHEIFMQAPAPMCLLSGDTHVFTMANPKYMDMVKRDVLGKTLDEVFAPGEVDFYKKIIKQVYGTGEPYIVNQAPLELFNADGVVSETRYINVGYHAYKDAAGKVKGVLVIVLDVTDQVNSVIVRDNFMGIASHELKTPLTALKLQNQMNKKALEINPAQFDRSRMEKLLNTTGGQIDRLIRLVDDMLDISRITADKLSMNFAISDLSKLTREVFENFLPQIQTVGIELKLDLEPDLLLKMDEARIEQVITNLITNVMKYASMEPVEVSLKKNEKNAILRVTDHGRGIEEKNFEKIFQRFERVDEGRDISGLGIGLYVSRKIVLAHFGKLSVESQFGKGTTFTMELPLKDS